MVGSLIMKRAENPCGCPMLWGAPLAGIARFPLAFYEVSGQNYTFCVRKPNHPGGATYVPQSRRPSMCFDIRSGPASTARNLAARAGIAQGPRKPLPHAYRGLLRSDPPRVVREFPKRSSPGNRVPLRGRAPPRRLSLRGYFHTWHITPHQCQ